MAMLRRSWIVLFCLALPMGCGNDSDESMSSDEARTIASGGAGSWQAKLCAAKGQPADCDFCAAWGWYGESATGPDPSKCDSFCPKPDPDCPVVACVQNGNRCCQGTTCSALSMMCPGGSTPTYSCDANCVPQGKCSPSTQDAVVTLNGNGIKGFEVKVDNVSVGKEGTPPDVLDGKFTFNVKGNANHNIWVTDGFYVYQSNGYFMAGRSYTINMNPLPPPGPTVDVTIMADWAGYDVNVDGAMVGHSTGKNFSFKVTGDANHTIDVYDGSFHYNKTIYFKKGESKIIYVNKASSGGFAGCDDLIGCGPGGVCGDDFTCHGGPCPGILCSPI
jgi:hypothetical protein